MPMRLLFTQLFALEQKQIAIMASQKSPPRISDCLFAINRSEKRISMRQDYTEFNKQSTTEYPSIDDVEDAIDFLKAPASFRSFRTGLIKIFLDKYIENISDNSDSIDINFTEPESVDSYAEEQMAKCLFNKLHKIGSSIEYNTVLSWFQGKHRPKVEAAIVSRYMKSALH